MSCERKELLPVLTSPASMILNSSICFKLLIIPVCYLEMMVWR